MPSAHNGSINTVKGVVGSSAPLLVAQDLHKAYDQRAALRGLSFSLQSGHILGFLGPNGAGKTTAIRILTTMMEPDAGDFSVAGISSTRPDEIRRLIGVLPENLGFPKHITGVEYLTYYGQLYGRTARESKAHALQLLDEVGLEKRGRSLLGSYSHGMRQRIGIARALVNDPLVVFLDEPTLGLDPRGQQELLALIRRTVQDRHVGVILCSHALWEIEVICDDVLILNQGQVAAAGTVADVVGRGLETATRRNALRIQVPSDATAAARALLAGLPDVKEATTTGEAAGWLRVELVPSQNGDESQDFRVNNRILEALIRNDIPILNFEAAGGRLNEVFLYLTEERAK